MLDLIPGELIITEVMKNPIGISDDDGEWFEIKVLTSSEVDLIGLQVEDADGDSMIINSNFMVQPNDLVLLAVSGDSLLNGGIEPDIVYSVDDFQLANSNDEIMLLAGGTLIDEIFMTVRHLPGQVLRGILCFQSTTAARSQLCHRQRQLFLVRLGKSYGDGSQMGTPGKATIILGFS